MPSLRLRPVTGARRGQELVFSGPRVRIGRSRDNDVILPERDAPLSSGHHAEAILDSAGVWSIVDLDSSNGTSVNHVAVGRQSIKHGDRLTFGDQEFEVGIGETPPGRARLSPVWAVAVAAAVIIAGIVLVEKSRSKHSPFEEIATRASASVYMVGVEENGVRSTVGTAFAIGADGMLATNAHVVNALKKRGALSEGGSARAVAVLGDAYNARPIVVAVTHPEWKEGSIRGDIAVLRLASGPMLMPLRLANRQAIDALRRGTTLAAFGFPAVSTDPEKPRGRLSVDVLGDVRGSYFEVGLGIAPGTSGSPVFNEAGAVVGIVAGGDFTDAPGGVKPTGSAANWVLSIATLDEILADRK